VNEKLAAALQERDVLVAQAIAEHESNVQSEMRRFREDIARIENVFLIRTSIGMMD
jgi:hypothetical protein